MNKHEAPTEVPEVPMARTVDFNYVASHDLATGSLPQRSRDALSKHKWIAIKMTFKTTKLRQNCPNRIHLRVT